MKRILHLSDFHITPESPKPQDERVLRSLIGEQEQKI